MCGTCGCATRDDIKIASSTGHQQQHHPGDEPHHHHDHDSDGHHHHHHDHDGDGHHHHHHQPITKTREIAIGQAVLAQNEQLAARNRDYFQAQNLLVLNVMSSPGSGKTTWIERTLTDLRDRLSAGVVVGDLATDNDAQRLRRSGAPVAQITTGTLCHLEADLVLAAAQHLPLEQLDLLVVENVGNLVCPAAYDLGESLRVVLLSTTEGEDKPLKYPTAFKSADVVILNKIDIADVVGCDRELAVNNIRQIAPQAQLFELSARSGEGLDAWYQFLGDKVRELVTAKVLA
ncbi:MAG: hydrogenase nickel incorporation protein HypB [Spirulinaceae cyanobacterium SM2_1_0]|nr:hydrogenase nickel incorporation protein HypB [Spirulinaceae cyanobacterium SM2_1_0]